MNNNVSAAVGTVIPIAADFFFLLLGVKSGENDRRCRNFVDMETILC